MTQTGRDPLTGTARVLVDGNNLLGALRRGGAGATEAGLVARLRAAMPGVAVELVFDGPPQRGVERTLTGGVTVRFARMRSADQVLIDELERVGRTGGPAATGAILVVTDDRALRDALRARGGRSAGTAWLIRRLDRHRGAPAPRRMDVAAEDDDDREPWRPGRGATTKRGNPRHAPRQRR